MKTWPTTSNSIATTMYQLPRIAPATPIATAIGTKTFAARILVVGLTVGTYPRMRDVIPMPTAQSGSRCRFHASNPVSHDRIATNRATDLWTCARLPGTGGALLGPLRNPRLPRPAHDRAFTSRFDRIRPPLR